MAFPSNLGLVVLLLLDFGGFPPEPDGKLIFSVWQALNGNLPTDPAGRPGIARI